MNTQTLAISPTNNLYYNEDHFLFLNGEYVKSNDAFTDLYGQTLPSGYGAFEGIRTYPTAKGTRIFKAQEHFDRLKRSCELVGIPFDFDTKELVEKSYELLKKNNLEDAYIRPLVFCSPNMQLYKPKEVSIMICAWHWGAYLGGKLLKISFSSYCRPHPKSIKIEAKICGHYINSIISTTEAKDNGFDEALLLDSDGFLAEGPGANLFFEKNGELFTPQLGNILPGITRATIIELCRELNIKVSEGLYLPELLLDADAAFYCGTAAEVIGIESVDHFVFPLQWDKTLGKKLQIAYQNLVHEKQ